MQNQTSFAEPVTNIANNGNAGVRTFVAEWITRRMAAASDPVAMLWLDHIAVYDGLTKLHQENGNTDPNHERSEVDRAKAIVNMLTYTQPTSLEGAVACLRAAKNFTNDIVDFHAGQQEMEADKAYEAAMRCVENAIVALVAMGAEIPE